MARVLAIANRAEIAVRIARTARQQGWHPVALIGEPDWESFAAREVGSVVRLERGGEFDVAAVVQAATEAGASALHPGYGFLSERAELSRACADAGIIFVGPSPETLALSGDKIATRNIATQHGVPVVPGSEALDLTDAGSWASVAADIGYPVIAKVAGAGGGRGLRVANHPDELDSAIKSALNEAGGSGAARELFLEHFLQGARHVEVQVAGDGRDSVVLGDRDCSLQRRHQKVIEEGPAPGLPDVLRQSIHDAARQMAAGIGLLNLATVEFLVADDGRYFFMEINPRLQVEHTVTEEVTGLDLVALQLDLAHGGELPVGVTSTGHAIQARLYAEDPFQQFLPSPGTIRQLDFPIAWKVPGATLRIDAGYEKGDSVPGSYDPMIAKLIVSAPDRERAVAALEATLLDLRVAGIATNQPWLLAALSDDGAFRSNRHDLTTAGAIQLDLSPPPDEVLAALVPAPAAAATAWESAGPFRIVAPATATFHGDEGTGWQKTIALDRDAASLQHLRPLILQADGGWEVVTPLGRWQVYPGPRASADSSRQARDGAIRAPMPGTLLQMLVEPGQAVEEDEVVAIMEAMKIEMSLVAPFSGTVGSVSAAEGDLVSSRQVLVSIEPALDEGEAR